LYSGPIGESLPTSISAFSHRRQRSDSNASFAYYQEEENEYYNQEGNETEAEQSYVEDGAVSLDIDDIPFELGYEADETTDSEVENGSAQGDYALHRRRSSTLSRISRSSVHARLLRTDSTRTDTSGRVHGRISQKLHIVNEDLTIVIAGFRTSRVGFLVYTLLCLLTLGLAYLLLRWLPRWQVKLIGEPCPLHECQWVVLEVSLPSQENDDAILHANSEANRTNGVKWLS
jgi:cation-transporting ATPase 13A3/4/5